MRDSPTVFVEWASFLARQSPISGCKKRLTIGSTLVLTSMTWAIASKDPQVMVDKLVKDYKFKLKGTGPISYHLRCDFMRDEDKVL